MTHAPLSDTATRVLRLLGGASPLTAEQVGRTIGVTREHARQVLRSLARHKLVRHGRRKRGTRYPSRAWSLAREVRP